MDTELKDLNPNTKNEQQQISDEGNLPLLKPNSSDDNHHQPPSKPITAAELEEMETKFAAYVRRDTYGPMGLGEVSFSEKLLLGIAMFTLVPLRLLMSIAILVLYYLICKVCTVFSTPNRSEEDQGQPQQEDYAHLGGWRRYVIVFSGRFLSRALLFTFGFYWISHSYRNSHTFSHQNERTDETEEELEKPGAVISNHVSYVDILYHMSSSFPSFVAKRSVGKLPLVGLISKCLGCVYVQREDKSSDFKGVSGVVTERIKEAHENKDSPMMLIFPEGTTTNGGFLLPFKTGAFIAGAPVHPVILRYPYKRFSPAWDSISGVRHVVLLLCQFVNYLEVTKLPVYYPSKEEKEDPKLYASNARKLMANEHGCGCGWLAAGGKCSGCGAACRRWGGSGGNLILSDIGLPEKRIYHAALNVLKVGRVVLARVPARRAIPNIWPGPGTVLCHRARPPCLVRATSCSGRAVPWHLNFSICRAVARIPARRSVPGLGQTLPRARAVSGRTCTGPVSPVVQLARLPTRVPMSKRGGTVVTVVGEVAWIGVRDKEKERGHIRVADGETLWPVISCRSVVGQRGEGCSLFNVMTCTT
ncbi:hypothetical protein KSS87_015082 [Heliosperma pusillum]|nr:hypothetical protein KSS87_015082 [Heliosperma pusillum]